MPNYTEAVTFSQSAVENARSAGKSEGEWDSVRLTTITRQAGMSADSVGSLGGWPAGAVAAMMGAELSDSTETPSVIRRTHFHGGSGVSRSDIFSVTN